VTILGAVIGRRRRSAMWLGLPALLLGSTGCFATRGDVRVLQNDINTVRQESQRSAQAQAQALAETARILQVVTDSLTRLSGRQLAFEGDVRGQLRRVNEQLIQVQELLGQSASNIRALRAEMEAAARMPGGMPLTPSTGVPPGSATVPPVGAVVDTPPVTGNVVPNPGLPGPTQLYQDGVDHFRRSSYESARIAFGDLLLNYPGSDLASEAQYWIAESYAAEGKRPAAETAYAAVVSKYPNSEKAPDALYKRALSLLEQDNVAAAKPLLEQVIARYPRSNAADFAKERLASIP
jgi:tol-pal system protein YbgF